jgi:hypothetical protein
LSKKEKTEAKPYPKPRVGKPAERMVMSGIVREQHAPFFEVHTRGVSVEFTDRRTEAHTSYQQAGAPKQMSYIDSLGIRHLLEETP